MNAGNVVLGIAIGAIVGVLFAPDKGSNTRRQIKGKSDDYANDLKSKFDEFRDSLSDMLESTKRDAEGLLDKGKDKFDDAKKDVKNAVGNFKHNDTADFKHANS